MRVTAVSAAFVLQMLSNKKPIRNLVMCMHGREISISLLVKADCKLVKCI